MEDGCQLEKAKVPSLTFLKSRLKAFTEQKQAPSRALCLLLNMLLANTNLLTFILDRIFSFLVPKNLGIAINKQILNTLLIMRSKDLKQAFTCVTTDTNNQT